MSDISISYSSSSSKRRLNEIDDTIAYLSQEVNTLNDFVHKTEFECSLMTVKMKREKVKAVSAMANTQVLLANMKVMLAENDLHMDIERLRNFKKMKLERNEGKPQAETPSPPQVTPPTTTTVSVQTIESMSNKKKKRTHSSLSKSPVDISSDETVIIPIFHESSTSLVEAAQTPSLSQSLFTQNKSNDSEVSLSSSIKEAFNEPYANTQETLKKSPTKKQKLESKSKSKHVSKHTRSPTDRPKTVAELRQNVSSPRPTSTPKNTRTGDKKSTACSTYVPVRHNMGVLPNPPRSSTMINEYPATQANNTQTFSFYGSKQ